MNNFIKSIVITYLKNVLAKLESNTCELTEEQAMDIMSVLGHEIMSKDEVYTYLNISRSKFDELVRDNKMPKGRKVRGFKELMFYKDEIDKYRIKLKK